MEQDQFFARFLVDVNLSRLQVKCELTSILKCAIDDLSRFTLFCNRHINLAFVSV